MSKIIETAVDEMNAKLSGGELNQSVKFVIENEGAFIVDGSGARISDEITDLTVTASSETFQGLQDGTVNATSAFMMGKIKVDGDMGLAMKLGTILG